MKNRVIFYMVCTCISLSSCLDKNNLNFSDRDKEEELDLSLIRNDIGKEIGNHNSFQ